MADAEAARRAREAPVGDQRDFVGETLAVKRRRRGQHLTHARTALGSLMADDDHITFLVVARLHGGECLLFAIENARGSSMMEMLQPGHFHDSAFGSEV